MRFAAAGKIEIGQEASSDGLWLAVDRASDALARFDERLRTSPVREGFLARLDFHEACAAVRNEGSLVHLEDLVLHDAGMDVRTPTAELVRAHSILRARRRLAAAGPALPTARQILALATERGDPDGGREGEGVPGQEGESGDDAENGDDLSAAIDAVLARSAKSLREARAAARQDARHPTVYDAEWDELGRVRDWLATVTHHDGKPAVLAAALAWESWDRKEPLQRSGFLGPMLVGAVLRARGKAKTHLPALHGGARLAAMSTTRSHRDGASVENYVAAIEAAAAIGMKELDRLTLAAEMLKRKCVGKRGNSKLPALAKLFVDSPIVTVPLAAERLGVSQQAATTMIDALSPALREITGRERYRAWSVL